MVTSVGSSASKSDDSTDEELSLSGMDNCLFQSYTQMNLTNIAKRPENIQQINAPTSLIYFHRQYNRFILDKGIVYYKWYKKYSKNEKREEYVPLIVVPQTMYEIIIRDYHEGVQNCHSGIENSVESCRRKFWFQNMRAEFAIFINSCPICNATKQAKKYNRPMLRPIIFREFNQGVSLDHVIPSMVEVTPRGNRYILTITCLFTGYLVEIPVKSQKADVTVEKLLENWITKFGWFQFILHDNHKTFVNELFKAMCKIYNIADKKTSPFYSQGNGKIESQNKRINACMRAILSDQKFKDWDKWLKYIVFTLNSLKCSRTGVSPNKLVFGRDLKFPRDLWLADCPEIDKSDDPLGNSENRVKQEAYLLHKRIREISLKTQRIMDAHVQAMCDQ